MDTSQIMMLISRIRELTHNTIVFELEKRNITDIEPAHGDIFNALNKHGELKMSDLAKAIGRKKNTITVLARKLVERGYLNERVDPRDSRSRLLSLTEKTNELHPKRKEVSVAVIDKIYQGFSEEEKVQLVGLLERVYENVK